MKGAALGAVLFEKLADTPADAAALLEKKAASGLPHCHHSSTPWVPRRAFISPSMAGLVVRNQSGNNLAYSNINEGLGRVLRFAPTTKSS
jgi:hypothetical protein